MGSVAVWHPRAFYSPTQPRDLIGRWTDVADALGLRALLRAADEKPWLNVYGADEATEKQLRTMNANAADLDLLPPHLLGGLLARGVQFEIGSGPVTTFPGLEHLEKVRPRGWVGGATWKHVAGIYKVSEKRVIAGVGKHGALSLILHETGHAIVRELPELLNTADLRDHHKRLYPRLDAYAKQASQGGPGNLHGMDELFAMSTELRLKRGRDAAVRRYDEEYVGWLEGALGL